MLNKFNKKISKNIFIQITAISLGVALVLTTFGSFWSQPAEAGSFNQNSLISDPDFLDINSLSISDIQDFLIRQNSFLQYFSENGRSAAEIIYGASHGYDEASGNLPGSGITINSSTGTVNPKVLLTTLQKEQSLISRTTRNDDALRTAMGYACPDSGGCKPAYQGFTKQVENAAWQLRFNYERAQGKGYPNYQVGQVMTMHDYNGSYSVNFTNRATSALYRYTPHVYNGNYSFWNLFFNNYRFQLSPFAGAWYWQSPFNPGGTTQIVVAPGKTVDAMIAFKNNGSVTWDKDVRLSVLDQASTKFADPSWLSTYRIADTKDVKTGEIATYQFKVKAPANLAPGTYYLKVELIDESNGMNWMYSTATFLQVKVPTIQEQYNGAWYWQSPFNPGGTSQIVVAPGETSNAMVAFKNNGLSVWDKDVRLSVINDVSTKFYDPSWISTHRIAASDNVQSGGVGTYQFKVKAPDNIAPGIYQLKVELVSEGDGMDWLYSTATYLQVRVPTIQEQYNGAWYWQSPFNPGGTSQIEVAPGGTANAMVAFKNNGLSVWDKDVRLSVINDVSTKFYDPSWLSSHRISVSDNVQSGGVGIYQFKIKAPADLAPGIYQFKVELVSEGKGMDWLYSTATYLQVKVG